MASPQPLPYQQELFNPVDLLVIDPDAIDIARDALPALNNSTTFDRRAIYALSTIFTRLHGKGAGTREEKWDMDGLVVKATLGRLHAFRNNQACSCCGIQGKFFILERHINEQSVAGFSLALYALDHRKQLVPMTVDHILPDSLGGRFATSNFQTMCRSCNQEKQHLMSQEEIDRIRSNVSAHAKEWVNVELLFELLNVRESALNTLPGDKLDALNQMFESYRKFLTHGTSNKKQSTIIDLIRRQLNPPAPPALPWYRVWMMRAREYMKDVPIPFIG